MQQPVQTVKVAEELPPAQSNEELSV